MWVFIDTHSSGTMRAGMISPTRVSVRTKKGRTSGLLALLSRVRDLTKADGVCIVSGPGSFSSVRAGVLIANLLARLLKKPLVGVARDEAEDLKMLAKRLENGQLSAVDFVVPVYDAEPNITVPRT